LSTLIVAILTKIDQIHTLNRFIRTYYAIRTQNGNNPCFDLGDIKGRGDIYNRKRLMYFNWSEAARISPKKPDGTFDITMSDFDKSDMATAKMLLKMAYESIYKSRRSLIQKYDFSELLDYLNNKTTMYWPFICYHKTGFIKEKSFSIPSFQEKDRLNLIETKLTLSEISNSVLLFDFKYYWHHYKINIVKREFSSWINIYYDNDTSTSLYPRFLHERRLKKIQKALI
jgi:hypothetical protein